MTEDKKIKEKVEEKKIDETKKEEKVEEKKKVPENKKETPKEEEKKEEKKIEEKDSKKKEKVAKKKEIKKPKKTEVIARINDCPISTKYAVALCRFIKNKPIEKAISDLNLVIRQKKPVPMKGEIAHKKGIMSGRFPKKASKHFISLLQSLYANANYFEIEGPIVSGAIANSGSRVYGSFGIKRKRTHLLLKAKSGERNK